MALFQHYQEQTWEW